MRMDRGSAGVWRLAAVIVVCCVTACGGSDDSGAEPNPDDGVAADIFGDGDGDDGDDGGGSGGDQEISLGGDIPDYFPSDFYLPDAMTVQGVSRSGEAISLTGIYEDGDPEAIQADIVAGLEAAGYELLSNEDTAAFVKNGVGRVRVRTRVFMGELTTSVDIDTWTDEQLDELRGLFAEEVAVPGRATAVVDGTEYTAEGECLLQGSKRSFFADDVSISIQVDEMQDPAMVYADVTTPDGAVYTTEVGADLPYESSDSELTASGDMVQFTNEAAGAVSFSVTATCDS